MRRKARNQQPKKRRLFRSLKSGIAAIGATATAVGGVVGLIFVFAPGLRPCIGDTTADFEPLAVRKVGPLEARVSYTIDTHGYQGKELRVMWSLLRSDASGSWRPVVEALPAETIEPSSCTADKGGNDLDIAVERKGDYQVVLELFPPGSGARIASAATAFNL